MRWYVNGMTYLHRGLCQMTLQDSPLSEARKRTPHSLLYFQMLLLQRLVDEYSWTVVLQPNDTLLKRLPDDHDSYVTKATKCGR